MSMESGSERGRDRSRQSQIVVVDLGTPQPVDRVSRLRKGKGKLFQRVEKIVDDLVEAGTVKSGGQTVVVVVREYGFPPPPRPPRSLFRPPPPPPPPPWVEDGDEDEEEDEEEEE